MEGGILMLEQRSQVQASLLELQGYFGQWKAGRGQGRIRCLLLAAGVGCCMRGDVCPQMLPTQRDICKNNSHVEGHPVYLWSY